MSEHRDPMSTGSSGPHDLGELWRGRAAPDRAGCLTEDQWGRLMSGDANAAERAHAATHIASCAACTEEYRLLKPFRSWAEEAAGVLAGPAAVQPGTAAASRWSWQSGVLPVAAAVLIVLQAGGLFFLQQRSSERTARLEARLADRERALNSAQSSLAEARAQLRGRPTPQDEGELAALREAVATQALPIVDMPIIDLEPTGTEAVRGKGGTPLVTVRTAARLTTVILNFEPRPARSTLLIEIADRQGTVRWSGRVAREAGTATLNLTLPRLTYPAGTYGIRVTDVSDGKTIASYRVVLGDAPN
jgi:hypothetical protein